MKFVELEEQLKDLPPTWYPQLLRTVIEASYAKDVWNGNELDSDRPVVRGCSHFVIAIEETLFGIERETDE